MFDFPPATRFGKSLPKSAILTRVSLTRRVKDLFTSQLAGIVWAHKLAPETLHLPATPGVPEILVFDLQLKAAALDDAVADAIDRAIPFPTLHRLHAADGRIAFSIAHKRPSAANPREWVTGSRFTSSFGPPPSALPPLPAAIDLGHLYAALFGPLLPLPPRPGEDLAAHLARCGELQKLEREIARLEARLRKERQFNQRVELNQQLKPLLAERFAISAISSPAGEPEISRWRQPPGFDPQSIPAPAGATESPHHPSTTPAGAESRAIAGPVADAAG